MKELFEQAFSEMPMAHSEETLLWEEMDKAVASLEEYEVALNRLVNLEAGSCTVLSMLQSCETDDAYAYCTGAIASINEQIEGLPLAQIVIPTLESAEAEDIQEYSIEVVGKVVKAVGNAIKKLYEMFKKMMQKLFNILPKLTKAREQKILSQLDKPLAELPSEYDVSFNDDYGFWFKDLNVDEAISEIKAISDFFKDFDRNLITSSIKTAVSNSLRSNSATKYKKIYLNEDVSVGFRSLSGEIKFSDTEKEADELRNIIEDLSVSMNLELALKSFEDVAKGLNSQITKGKLGFYDEFHIKPKLNTWWGPQSQEITLVPEQPVAENQTYYMTCRVKGPHFVEQGAKESGVIKDTKHTSVVEFYKEILTLVEAAKSLEPFIKDCSKLSDEIAGHMKKNGTFNVSQRTLGAAAWRYPAQLSMSIGNLIGWYITTLLKISKATVSDTKHRPMKTKF